MIPKLNKISRYPLCAWGAAHPSINQICVASGFATVKSLVTIAKHPTVGYFAINQFPQWHPTRQSRILAERFKGRNQEFVKRNQDTERQLNEKRTMTTRPMLLLLCSRE